MAAATAPRVSREILDERWRAAVTEPGRATGEGRRSASMNTQPSEVAAFLDQHPDIDPRERAILEDMEREIEEAVVTARRRLANLDAEKAKVPA